MQLIHFITVLTIAVPTLAMPAAVEAISARDSAAGNYITCPTGYVPADSQVSAKGSTSYMDINACCPKDHSLLYFNFYAANHMQCTPSWLPKEVNFVPTVKGTCKAKAKECKGHTNACCTEAKDQV